jgi:hypothetical protein
MNRSAEINLGEKGGEWRAQHFGKVNQLEIVDINPTSFDLGHSAPINVPAGELEFDGQALLAPTALPAQPADLTANQVHYPLSV